MVVYFLEVVPLNFAGFSAYVSKTIEFDAHSGIAGSSFSHGADFCAVPVRFERFFPEIEHEEIDGDLGSDCTGFGKDAIDYGKPQTAVRNIDHCIGRLARAFGRQGVDADLGSGVFKTDVRCPRVGYPEFDADELLVCNFLRVCLRRGIML